METYVEYDICVNGKAWHIVVSEEHDEKTTWAVLTYRSDKVFRCARQVAKCNPADEFDLAIGVKTAVERMFIAHGELCRPIWHGFRRAQWHKLHDVTDEQMMITHWMPIENIKKQDDDGWVSVDERFPERLGPQYSASKTVEVKDKSGIIYPYAWYDLDVPKQDFLWGWNEEDKNGRFIRRISDIVSWRPMRGDK